jgi:hypothetical protein
MGIPFIWIIILALFVAIALGTYFLTNTSNGGNTPSTTCILTKVNAGDCDNIGPIGDIYRDTQIPEVGVTRFYTDSNCTSLATELSTATTEGDTRVLLTFSSGILSNLSNCPASCTEFSLFDGMCGFGSPITRYAFASEITEGTQIYTDDECTIEDAGITAYNDTLSQYNAPGADGLITSTESCSFTECYEYSLNTGGCGNVAPVTKYATVSSITEGTQLYTDSSCSIEDAQAPIYNNNTSQFNIEVIPPDGIVRSITLC